MPAITSEFAGFQQRVDSRWGAFLLLHAADDADLIAELAVGLSDWMDVET
jgi:hypothetical protein